MTPATRRRSPLPRQAPGLVSPPARSARVDRQPERHGVRAGRLPPAPRELAHAQHLRPRELRDRQRRLGLRRVRQHAPDLARVDGLQRRAHDGRMPSLALVANICATSVWNCVARTIVHGTPRSRYRLLGELELVVRPADAVDADDRDAT